MAAVSPSSSPRLPSPPPMAEDQTGPQSPNPNPGNGVNRELEPSSGENGAARRIRPGTKAEDIAEGPPLVELSEIDSAFQLSEHLKALHMFYTQPSGSPTTLPITPETAGTLCQPPPGIDRSLWLYELCRFLIQKSNSMINSLFVDTPPCSAATCPEMRASEWQYLCAVHDPPKSCAAIDYSCHTLDWAANVLTSPKHFPSRLTLGGGTGEGGGPAQHQVRQLTNIFRRVYRIFAHAWFQHRDMFWRVESKSGLYILFKTVCDTYQLIQTDNYTIPPEAEGKAPLADQRQVVPGPILRRPDMTIPAVSTQDPTPASPAGLTPGATARRHKHTPSKGAPVSTVMEENEDEDEEAKASAMQAEALADSSSVLAPPLRPMSSTDTIIHEPVQTVTGTFEPASDPPPMPTTPIDLLDDATMENITIASLPSVSSPETPVPMAQDGFVSSQETTDREAKEARETTAADGDAAGKTVGD